MTAMRWPSRNDRTESLVITAGLLSSVLWVDRAQTTGPPGRVEGPAASGHTTFVPARRGVSLGAGPRGPRPPIAAIRLTAPPMASPAFDVARAWTAAAMPGHRDHQELHEHGDLVRRRRIRELHLVEVPDAGDDEQGEGRPGDAAEPGGGEPGCLRVDAPQDRHQADERDLSADPHAGAQDVQRDADRLGRQGEHSG